MPPRRPRRARAKPPDFTKVRQLFAKFRHARMRAKAGNLDLLGEADHRLKRSEWICQRVWKLEDAEDRAERSRFIPGTPAETLQKQHARRSRRRRELSTEIILLCEAFYYLAWRFSKIVQIEGKQRFVPKGICAARNDLLEHPERTNSFAWSFVFGRDVEHGPALKPFTRPGGLYLHADELIALASVRLQALIEEDIAKAAQQKGGVK